MEKTINYLNPALLSLGRIPSTPNAKTASQQPQSEATAASFDQILQRQMETNNRLHFSAHALQRVESREIQLQAGDMTRIENAVNQAEAKGAKNTLVLSQDYALIVNVPNRTVVTAFGRSQANNQQIITNIDSTVMLD